MGAQTSSRRYDVMNDHTLTANGPPRGLDLNNLRISAGELPFFRAVAAFESEIGMAIFVQETIPMKQTWHGHSAVRIEAGEAKILIDPFLSDNPSRNNGWSGYLTGKNSTQGGDR